LINQQKKLIFRTHLNKYPKKNKDISNINFNLNNTPFKYENYITYGFDEKISQPKSIKNDFWIKEITFLSYFDFYTKKYNVNCGIREYSPTQYYNYAKSNRFFIEYTNNSKFINLNEEKSKTNNTDSVNNNSKFKIGDKVICKDGFRTFNATVTNIDGTYYHIEYKNKKGETKTRRVTKSWLTKVD